MKLEAVACILVAGSYLMEVIGLILLAAARGSERERERRTVLVNQWYTETWLAPISLQPRIFFAVTTVELERKSGLLTLWCDRELLGASVCVCVCVCVCVWERESGRRALCSCWRTRQEQMGNQKERKKKKERHRNTRQTQMYNPSKPVRSIPESTGLCGSVCEKRKRASFKGALRGFWERNLNQKRKNVHRHHRSSIFFNA